jgi:hypothetical protein
MDQAVKTFPPEGLDARRWIGWTIIAVILGEALWNLIVSVMNNLVVPWLGDVMGTSSGLPTSFVQRPYDYPALFVSILESCIAVIVAAVLNYSLQRQRGRKAKPVGGPVSIAPLERERVISQPAAAVAITPAASPAAREELRPPAPPAPFKVAPAEPAPFIPPASVVTPAAAPLPARPVAESVAAKPSPPAPPAQPVVEPAAPKSPPPAPPVRPVAESAAPKSPPKAEPPKAKKAKPVYYNIVGEPMPSDED